MTTAPVLDADALGRLGDQLGDTATLCGFIRRYENLLDQRVERLRKALAARNHDDWMDAVLSLKTSSAMAGAVALSDLAAELQETFAKRPPNPVTWPARDRLVEIVENLHRLAEETGRQLRLFLDRIGTMPRFAN